MVLISDAVVIVEAGARGGAHHAGWEALRLGRPLFLMESVVRRGMDWPEKMIAYEARVLRELEDLLDALASPGGRLRGERPFRLVTVGGGGSREGVDLDRPRELEVSEDEASWSSPVERDGS